MFNQQTLTAVEQTMLAALEGQTLNSFVPQADKLSSQGFPRLAQQLDLVHRDLRSARTTYYKMYQNSLLLSTKVSKG